MHVWIVLRLFLSESYKEMSISQIRWQYKKEYKVEIICVQTV